MESNRFVGIGMKKTENGDFLEPGARIINLNTYYRESKTGLGILMNFVEIHNP